MIVENNLTSYIHSLESDECNILKEIRAQAEAADVPIIRREMESFIGVLLNIIKPRSILEIGTAVGYSSIFFALKTDSECKITTIENYEPRIIEAKKNIEAASLNDRITLLEGDAVEILKNIEDCYDLIFLDASKGQYIVMLPDILRLLDRGGVLLADNVLQEGELCYSRYIVSRRQRTIHERMRDFLYEIKHNDMLESSILTVGDGVALCVKQ